MGFEHGIRPPRVCRLCCTGLRLVDQAADDAWDGYYRFACGRCGHVVLLASTMTKWRPPDRRPSRWAR